MARIHPPLENWRRVSGEIRTEPLISSGNIRRLQREERPRGDPRRAQPEEAPQPPAESEVYFRSGVSAHVTSYGFSTKKAKKKRTKIECSKYWCHYGTEKSLTQTIEKQLYEFLFFSDIIRGVKFLNLCWCLLQAFALSEGAFFLLKRF